MTQYVDRRNKPDELTDKKRTNREKSNANLKPFKPGEVHNPNGRPPNKKYLSEIARELLEQIPTGELQGRNADVLVVLALVRKALGGDTKAIEMLHDWTEGKVTDTHKIMGDVPVSIVYKQVKDATK